MQKALDDLTRQSKELISRDGELELRISGEFIFVNQTRLRLDLDNFASFSHLLSLLRASGIGTVDGRSSGVGQGLAGLPVARCKPPGPTIPPSVCSNCCPSSHRRA